MALGHVPIHMRDFMGRMGTYQAFNPAYFADQRPAAMGFAQGENIGIYDQPNIILPSIPVGPVQGGFGAGVAGTVFTGAIISAVAGAGAGQGSAVVVDAPPEGDQVHTETIQVGQGPWGPETTYRPGRTVEEELERVRIGLPPEDEGSPFFIPVDASAGDELEPESGNVVMPSVYDAIIGGLSGGIDILQGQSPGGTIMPTAAGFAPTVAAAPAPGAGGQYYVNSAGKVCQKKRRRRRRLLTDRDYDDLVRIGTLPNKEGVKIALAKAVASR